MKNFDTNRFWQVLKWNLITDKHNLRSQVLLMVATFFVIQLLSVTTFKNLMLQPDATDVLFGLIMSSSMGFAMLCYYASGFLGNARRKELRATVLMLPASNAEKFVARTVYCMVLMPLLVVVCFFAGTGLRMLVQLLFGQPHVISGFSMFFTSEPHFVLYMSLFHLWSLSVFMLGGMLFSKRPFIWTVVSLTALFILIGIFAGSYHMFSGHTIGHSFGFKMSSEMGRITMVLLTVFNFWMSYRLFTRLQIVQHKWFNV
jgi:hypothetical protein